MEHHGAPARHLLRQPRSREGRQRAVRTRRLRAQPAAPARAAAGGPRRALRHAAPRHRPAAATPTAARPSAADPVRGPHVRVEGTPLPARRARRPARSRAGVRVRPRGRRSAAAGRRGPHRAPRARSLRPRAWQRTARPVGRVARKRRLRSRRVGQHRAAGRARGHSGRADGGDGRRRPRGGHPHGQHHRTGDGRLRRTRPPAQWPRAGGGDRPAGRRPGAPPRRRRTRPPPRRGGLRNRRHHGAARGPDFRRPAGARSPCGRGIRDCGGVGGDGMLEGDASENFPCSRAHEPRPGGRHGRRTVAFIDRAGRRAGERRIPHSCERPAQRRRLRRAEPDAGGARARGWHDRHPAGGRSARRRPHAARRGDRHHEVAVPLSAPSVGDGRCHRRGAGLRPRPRRREDARQVYARADEPAHRRPGGRRRARSHRRRVAGRARVGSRRGRHAVLAAETAARGRRLARTCR